MADLDDEKHRAWIGASEEQYKRIKDFWRALGTGWSNLPAAEDWTTSGLQDAFQTYARGAHRVWQYPQLLIEVYRHALDRQFVADAVRLKETGTLAVPQYPTTEAGWASDEFRREVEVIEKTREENKAILAAGNLPPGSIRSRPRAPGTSIADIGYADIAAMVANTSDEQMRQKLSSFYESLVISSWTTFESVAEDTWEAAVNSRPSKLGYGNIALDVARLHKFQIADKVGTIIKRARSFRTLKEIQNEYGKTFNEDRAPIMNVLEDGELKYSAAVRNVLIHKGGKIDSEYLDQIAGIPAAYRGEPGERFPLTGIMARNMANASLSSALGLLKAVRAWLVGNPAE